MLERENPTLQHKGGKGSSCSSECSSHPLRCRSSWSRLATRESWRITQHRHQLHSSTDADCFPGVSPFQCLNGNKILTSFLTIPSSKGAASHITPQPQAPACPELPTSQRPPRARGHVWRCPPAKEPGWHLSRERSSTFLSTKAGFVPALSCNPNYPELKETKLTRLLIKQFSSAHEQTQTEQSWASCVLKGKQGLKHQWTELLLQAHLAPTADVFLLIK